jgi:hypothetical protein
MHDPEWGTPTRARLISPKQVCSATRGRTLDRNSHLELCDVHSSSPLRSRASSCSKDGSRRSSPQRSRASSCSKDAPRRKPLFLSYIILTAAFVASALYILVWQRDALQHVAPASARLAFTNFTADLEDFDTTPTEEHYGPDTLFRKGAINRGQC